jgi:formate-nitrite transporter family protein
MIGCGFSWSPSRAAGAADVGERAGLSDEEQQEIGERQAPSAKVVHGTVAAEGLDELNRPLGSLLWSAIAAGAAIITTVFATGALRAQVPPTPWREAIVSLGYPLGFLIIILGRLQLFTEQTIVAVLPFARQPSFAAFLRVARLWTLVFAGNLVGAAAAAALVVFGKVQSTEVLDGMLAVAMRLQDKTALQTLLTAIPAGFMIASIAWIRAATEGSGFGVVATITYGIALCGFTHVIAGAAEAFLMLWHGDATAAWVFGGFLVPALVGNVLGGTGLFALLAHAQVKDEI